MSSETPELNRAHPDRSTVSLQLKIPVSVDQATLGALSARERHPAGDVAARPGRDPDRGRRDQPGDVRPGGDQPAVPALLRHAGSVSSLLTVQNQINDEESSLVSLARPPATP